MKYYSSICTSMLMLFLFSCETEDEAEKFADIALSVETLSFSTPSLGQKQIELNFDVQNVGDVD